MRHPFLFGVPAPGAVEDSLTGHGLFLSSSWGSGRAFQAHPSNLEAGYIAGFGAAPLMPSIIWRWLSSVGSVSAANF